MKHQGIVVARLRTVSVLSAAAVALMLPVSAPSVSAQDMGWWLGNSSPSSRRVTRMHRQPVAKRWRENEDRERRHSGKEVVGESRPSGPLFAILSISNQHISVYNSSGLVTRSKVSTGMPGHRTPMGIFTIIGRERYHSSNIYSGAPMPFMQRITWSGVAMHLGVVPGYPASHGCIRLPAGAAERMWGLTKIGERVVIAPHEVEPAAFAHPLLPVPKLQAFPSTTADNGVPKPTEVASAGNDYPTSAPPKLLNPLEYAQALKARAVAEIGTATKTLENQGSRGKEAPPEVVRKALSDLRGAENARSQAEAKLAVRIEALATKRDTREIQRAQAAKEAAEAALAEANKRLEAILENPTFATPEGQTALEAERNLMALRASLTKARAVAREAERRLAPISVLVSKKDNKVYVRQALAPMYEAPIVIKDRDAALGTLVYIATSHADGSSLGWTVISYPVMHRRGDDAGPRGRRDSGEHAKVEPELISTNPAQALERIEFPAEVSSLIAERLWIGGSLIITDESLSDETSDSGTDLVVTMR